jgi:hypothetical protein
LRENKAHVRFIGNIVFVGELHKLGVISDRTVHVFIQKLFVNDKSPSPEDLEALCKLLSTIGKVLDDEASVCYTNVYFDRIDKIVKQPALPMRIKFLLLGVIDLRKNGWIPRDLLGEQKPAKATAPVSIPRAMSVHAPAFRATPPMTIPRAAPTPMVVTKPSLIPAPAATLKATSPAFVHKSMPAPVVVPKPTPVATTAVFNVRSPAFVPGEAKRPEGGKKLTIVRPDGVQPSRSLTASKVDSMSARSTAEPSPILAAPASQLPSPILVQSPPFVAPVVSPPQTLAPSEITNELRASTERRIKTIMYELSESRNVDEAMSSVHAEVPVQLRNLVVPAAIGWLLMDSKAPLVTADLVAKLMDELMLEEDLTQKDISSGFAELFRKLPDIIEDATP